MSINRIKWIDVAKGIGIILVVIGHSDVPFASHYIFWFHMPLFFILSGMTFKWINSKDEYVSYVKKRINRLLIPYVSFAILIYVVTSIIDISLHNLTLIGALKNAIKVIYGGKEIGGYFAVFWFVTCLFFTEIFFALIILLTKKMSYQIAIIVILYLIAHLEAIFIKLPLPWNIDVSMISLSYFAFGFYIKKYIEILIKNIYFISVILLSAIFMIYADHYNVLKFTLDMKNKIYSNIFLDLIIPVLFCLLIFSFSFMLSKINFSGFFEKLGGMSMVIMFLHFPINLILLKFVSYNWLEFVLIGLMIPMLLYQAFDRKNINIFLGRSTYFY